MEIQAVVDGEVIAADETGRPQFCELLRVPRSACYVAFDILWVDVTDLRSLPLRERRCRLQTILPKGSPVVSEALFVVGRGCELFELMRVHDLEGIVAKRLDGSVRPARPMAEDQKPRLLAEGGERRPVQRAAAAAGAFRGLVVRNQDA